MRVIARPGTALAVLTGINVLNYLDRFMVAALLPLITPALHLSGRQGGLLQSIFIIMYLAVSPLMGWLGDRGPRLRLAAAGVMLWSVATLGSGLATSFAFLLIARALVGVGEASYAVVTPSLISDLYPAGRRGRVLSTFYVAIPVGTALGYMLGGSIGQRHGWQTAFFVGGGPGLLLALLLLVLPEPPRGRFDPPRADVVPPSLAASFAALRRLPSYFFNTAAQTIYTFGIGGLAAWMPTYFVRERHIPLERAGLLFGLVVVLAGIIGTLLGGQLAARLARRFAGADFSFSGVALLATVPFTLLAILSPRPAIFWPAMFATLLLLFLNTGPLNGAMANVLPPELRARGFALYTVAIHLLGDALSPTLIGAASDVVGLRLPVLLCGLSVSLAGVVLLAGRHALVADLGAARS
jgi:MFS transporter, Spinster family, sphingosine-1-phosphate transporter